MYDILSYIHLSTIIPAYIASRRGNTKRHRNNMIGLYYRGILLAGGGAMLPDRMLGELLFS
jgi:uncharacterized membrane protein